MAANIPFEQGETRMNSGSEKILIDYALRVVTGFDMSVTIIVPAKSYCKQTPVSDINAKRVDNVKMFLVKKGIPENEIFASPECTVIDSVKEDNLVVVETIGDRRRCFEEQFGSNIP